MRTRATLLRELRLSLVAEARRDGKTREQAERYATEELRHNADKLAANRVLRMAVRGCRA
jgi:hypothetical protein